METTIEFPTPVTVSSPPNEANTTNHASFWDEFEAFYAKHGRLLEQCSNVDLIEALKREKKADLETWVGSYTETVKIVLGGLASLGKIHPVIGVAVEAFGLVVSLDIARREIDKKVTIIRVGMQSMMCAMFQLRHLKDSATDAKKSRADLHGLIASMTEDIIKCSGDLNGYTSQKTLTRVINSKVYQGRFKDHLDNFARHRAALNLAITSYIAGGVDRANIQLSNLLNNDVITHEKLDALDNKVDIFQQLFCSPKEWEALKFIAKHGVKACVEQDELLQKLLTLAGDDLVDNEKGPKTGQLERRMAAAREEYKKDFVATLEENRERFEQILTLLKINHEQVFDRLVKNENYNQLAISKLDKLLYIINPDVKLADPELQRVWKLMGYKTIAKAKHFVLTFRDHYQHVQSMPMTPTSPQTNEVPFIHIDQPSAPSNTLSVSTADPTQTSSTGEDPNAWLLEYLDVAHVRPIVEAMDIDGSGFISVEELNLFAHSRPKDWSLLQWMVYWAAGWHLNVVDYREKIYDILVQMHEAVPGLHPANSVPVSSYLDSFPIRYLEGVLRFTQDVHGKQSSQLRELAESYARVEESNLKTKLEATSYILASDADAILVGGAGRPESWFYPLVYLVLQRHLAIINLAKTHILHKDEMTKHYRTLDSLKMVLEQRKNSLQAIFSQLSQSVESRFESFAWGTFYAFYNAETEVVPAKNALFAGARSKRATQDLILKLPQEMSRLALDDDTSALALERGEPLVFVDHNIFDVPESNNTEHPLNGFWSCVDYSAAGNVDGIFHYVLSISADGTVTGNRESWAGFSKVFGKVELPSPETGTIDLYLDYIIEGDHIYLKGVYDPLRESITAERIREERVPEDPALLDVTTPAAAFISASEEQEEKDDGEEAEEGGEGENGEEERGEKDEEEKDEVGRGVEEEDEVDEENEEEEELGPSRLYMTRTDANVVYLRRYLDSEDPAFPRPIPSPARRRWFFAIDATIQLSRIQCMNWKYVKAKFAERRTYVDLAMKENRNLLSDDDLNRLYQLTTYTPPYQARLYEAVAKFLLDRSYIYRTGWGISCDACHLPIICERYRCVTCVNKGYTNQIDLCTDDPSCINSAASNEWENFVHDPSHTLLRQRGYIFSCDLPTLLSQCRALSDSIKKRYSTLAEERKAAKMNIRASRHAKALQRPAQLESTVQPLHCECCGKELMLPCWICVTCDSETAFCLECDEAHAEIKGGMHTRNHLVLRIHDSKEVQAGEVNNARLQQELNKIASDVHALENKVTVHLKTATQWIKASAEIDGTKVQDVGGVGTATQAHPYSIDFDDPELADLDLGSDYGEYGLHVEQGNASSDMQPNPPTGMSPPPFPPDSFVSVNDGLTPTSTLTSDAIRPVEPHAVDFVDASSINAHLAVAQVKDPEVLNLSPSTVLDGGLSSLQARVASLDDRMSSMEASVTTNAAETNARLSRIESQLGELVSLLNQIASR